MSNPKAVTRGVHHAGLTVTDLEDARSFFMDVLGYDLVGEKPDYPACFVTDGHTMITLWQVKDVDTCNDFNRHQNIGLHHLALDIPDTDTLRQLHQTFVEKGYDIEFAPENMGKSGRMHMMAIVPGGVRMEFNAPATQENASRN